MLLVGYAPMRLAEKIAMTYALACEMYRLVDMVVWDGDGGLAMCAAIALGYVWLVAAPRGVLGRWDGQKREQPAQCLQLLLCVRERRYHCLNL